MTEIVGQVQASTVQSQVNSISTESASFELFFIKIHCPFL
jgi:hypothetical protein